MRLPKTPPETHLLIKELLGRGVRVWEAAPTLADGRYLAWDDLQRRPPPEGLNSAEWWAVTRFARTQQSRPIVAMERCYRSRFSLADLPSIRRALHDFDRIHVGDQILTALGHQDAKEEYRVRQRIEEAISSSEIEGARPTTREAAQLLLREKRAPVSRDERMIVNNLRAMERLREWYQQNERLTLSHLLKLHEILGEGALDVEGASGKFRTNEHAVVISDLEGNVWHTPPDAENLSARMEQLLAFAHGETDETGDFIHPIVRAIVTHFWLGYEHPFRDGNGRMARALYYWCMLRNGYEVAEFLSISGPIDRSPNAYYLAFAQTEVDQGDLTYFVLHQLKVMQAALDDLLQHLKHRAERRRELGELIASLSSLNYRQRSLLEHAITHPRLGSSIESHATSHSVHYMTAREDLLELEKRGMLVSQRVQRTKRFYPAESLLRAAAGRRSV